MSSVQLLDKTRKIGKLLHNNNSSKVVFNDICDVMTDILLSNVLVISKKGKVLGLGLRPEVTEITELIEDKVGGYIDSNLNERLLGILSTKENVNLETLGFTMPNNREYAATIAPCLLYTSSPGKCQGGVDFAGAKSTSGKNNTGICETLSAGVRGKKFLPEYEGYLAYFL